MWDIYNILSVVVFALLVFWGIWALVRTYWTSATETTAGQAVSNVVDTTQGYTIYGLLEVMKLDDQVKADANAIGAIAYLQSVALRGVAKDWTVKPNQPTKPVKSDPGFRPNGFGNRMGADKMKITTTKVIQLTAAETSNILCEAMAQKMNVSGELSKATSDKAKDLDGLAAEVTLVFESENAQ